jgi:multicomponent Na+:H+ antiporter subunit F
MTTVGIICAVLLSLTGLVCLIRIVRGPTMLDRTVAVDVFVAACVGAIGVEAAVGRHSTTLPILVALSLVAFLSSVSIARYAAPSDITASADPTDADPEETS